MKCPVKESRKLLENIYWLWEITYFRRLEFKYIKNSQTFRVRNDKPIRKHTRDMKRLFSEGYTGDK